MPVKFTPHNLTFSTKFACEIAEIDPHRLNDAIAAKDGYQCAPETKVGVARKFGEFDLISLFLFRFLSGHGHSQKLASMYACGVLRALKHSYHKLPERFDFPLNPFPDESIACMNSDSTTFLHSGNLLSYATIGFNIELLRKEICDRMDFVAERENNHIGSD